MAPRIDGLAIDDVNEEKFAAHGITVHRVLETLQNDYITIQNRKQRRGLYLLIGTDNGGSCIAVPIERTRDTGIWRPITAWGCKDHERARLP